MRDYIRSAKWIEIWKANNNNLRSEDFQGLSRMPEYRDKRTALSFMNEFSDSELDDLQLMQNIKFNQQTSEALERMSSKATSLIREFHLSRGIDRCAMIIIIYSCIIGAELMIRWKTETPFLLSLAPLAQLDASPVFDMRHV